MRFWLAIGIFIAVILIAFALFVLHITGSPRAVPAAPAPAFAPITDVSISDTYVSKTGVHTIKGSATVPTPCVALSATSTISKAGDASSTDQIRIDLSAPEDSGICVQVPEAKSFTITAHAGKDASITVYANGELATSTAD